MTHIIFEATEFEQLLETPLLHLQAQEAAIPAPTLSPRCQELLTPTAEQTESQRTAHEVAALALLAGQRAMELAEVERVPRYRDGRRENDAEHCFSLTVVATEIAHRLDIGLDMLDIHRFCIAHEWLELEMKDIATFLLDRNAIATKEALEKEVFARVQAKLPPYQRRALLAYEAQTSREARFVKLIDKMLPAIYDILGEGVRVMNEDYGVYARRRLTECHNQLLQRLGDRFDAEFPELMRALDVLYAVFELTAAPELD